jgi:hypothetical protein
VSGSVNPSVRIYNALGIEVFEKTGLVEFPYSIDLSHQISGIYFIKISDGENSVLKKLVLKN